jgi:hypothetical protein|tara:strand:- start:1755 stop:1892 length:138 start_codon:yes stop_codon:yes gene_type:complete
MDTEEVIYPTCKSLTRKGSKCWGAVSFDGYCFAHWSKLKYGDKKK